MKFKCIEALGILGIGIWFWRFISGGVLWFSGLYCGGITWRHRRVTAKSRNLDRFQPSLK